METIAYKRFAESVEVVKRKITVSVFLGNPMKNSNLQENYGLEKLRFNESGTKLRFTVSL